MREEPGLPSPSISRQKKCMVFYFKVIGVVLLINNNALALLETFVISDE